MPPNGMPDFPLYFHNSHHPSCPPPSTLWVAQPPMAVYQMVVVVCRQPGVSLSIALAAWVRNGTFSLLNAQWGPLVIVVKPLLKDSPNLGNFWTKDKDFWSQQFYPNTLIFQFYLNTFGIVFYQVRVQLTTTYIYVHTQKLKVQLEEQYHSAIKLNAL